MGRQDNSTLEIVSIELTGVAHGGFAVGRVDGRVVFVRGGIPGEQVAVRLTDTSRSAYWRGEVVDVIDASSTRIKPGCPVAGQCGGCDLQHVSADGQLEWKRRVLADQLSRLAGLNWTGQVERVDPVVGWRTRMRYQRGPDGIGLRAVRSHRIVPLPPEGCLIAHPDGREAARHASGDVIQVSVGTQTIAVNRKPSKLTQRVRNRVFSVSSTGFWQVHPAAPEILVDAVLAGLLPKPGQVALDLYCGVGLFSRFLCDADTHVVGIEGDQEAVSHARSNVPEATFHRGDVTRVLSRIKPQADIVVLDPPRSGSGWRGVTAITASGPSRVAYVSCEPSSLARDLAMFKQHGYQVETLRAFDLFPMTHHMECVVILSRCSERISR